MLDLCGASAEHFDVPPDELVGFGGDPNDKLPYGDDAFDDVLCSGGVGSMTHPRDDVRRGRARRAPGRALRLHVRRALYAPAPSRAGCRPTTPAACGSSARYFSLAPAFGPAESDLRTSLTGAGDRLWAVWAAKRG